jgi:nitrogen regulatory protein PII
MDMIEAVIQPQKLDAVQNALATLGILGVTAIEVKGYGRQAGHTERYRGARTEVGFVPKIMLQICVKPSDRDPAIHAIKKAARTGNVGDGKMFIRPISRVIRIRSGDEDEKAL